MKSLALLVYQKARLDAFLVDLTQQKETLEVLRSEVGKLQQQSLDRRLSRNDTFPTVSSIYHLPLFLWHPPPVSGTAILASSDAVMFSRSKRVRFLSQQRLEEVSLPIVL